MTANVDMSLVKKLREETGIGILECKKAIAESNNDFTKAAELLRKKLKNGSEMHLQPTCQTFLDIRTCFVDMIVWHLSLLTYFLFTDFLLA
jgi:hypothetical protein